MSTQELTSKISTMHAPAVPPPAKSPGVPPPPLPAREPEHASAHGDEEIPQDLHRPHIAMLALVVIVFLAALVGLFFAGWGPYKQEHALAAADAAEVASAVPTVSVMAPARENASHEIVLPCDIRPNQETLIYPRATGYLRKLNVDIQSTVKQGDVLAEIEAPEVDAQLAQSKAAALQARADVTKSQADLDLAERTLARYEDITAGGASKQERDQTESARDQAQAALAQSAANVKAADANVDRLEVMKSFQKITAPFDGVITARNYDVGALLSAENTTALPLFKLTQASTLRVFVSVPQVEASQIRVGQEATLSVRNFPDKTFTGKVALIADAVDSATRTMPFELHFDNADSLLYAGMYGEVRMKVTDTEPSITVPASALVFNAGGTQVAEVKGGKVHFAVVTVGQDFGKELEITQGITTDDQVVVNPSERLAEGVEVNTVAVKTADKTAEAPKAPAATQAAVR